MIENEKKYLLKDHEWFNLILGATSEYIEQIYISTRKLEIRIRSINNSTAKFAIKFPLKSSTSNKRIEIEFKVPYLLYDWLKSYNERNRKIPRLGYTIIKTRYILSNSVTIDVYQSRNFPLVVLEVEDPLLFKEYDSKYKDITKDKQYTNTNLFKSPYNTIKCSKG